MDPPDPCAEYDLSGGEALSLYKDKTGLPYVIASPFTTCGSESKKARRSSLRLSFQKSRSQFLLHKNLAILHNPHAVTGHFVNDHSLPLDLTKLVLDVDEPQAS